VTRALSPYDAALHRFVLPPPVPGALVDEAAFPDRPLLLAVEVDAARRIEARRAAGPLYAHVYFAPGGVTIEGRPSVAVAGLRIGDGQGEALADFRLRPEVPAEDLLLAGEWRAARLPLTARIAYRPLP
jgi:hypothetical protein